jgi:hypothetical protein
MLSIVYSSTAERSFDDVDLAQLLAQSRATNAAHGLTGLLVHRQGPTCGSAWPRSSRTTGMAGSPR